LIPSVSTKKIASLRPLGTPQQPLTPFCQKAALDPHCGPRTLVWRGVKWRAGWLGNSP